MRLAYSLLVYLALPFALAYFGLRGLRDRRYWSRWGERLGLGSGPAGEGATACILVHAASLGEVNAAAPLVEALLSRHPELPLLVTTFTPTGSQRVRELFGDRVGHRYLPLDLPGAVRRFMNRASPLLAVVIETEIWPNLYAQAARRQVPLLIVNARMTEESLRGYRLAGGLVREALAGVTSVLAQTRVDAERYVERGARPDRVRVTGNLKFDLTVPASLVESAEILRTRWGVERPTLVAGSTHEQDEAELFEAFLRLLNRHPRALLVLAPRHPERFGRVAQDARDLGLVTALRSAGAAPAADAQCLVVDTMGELPRYYAAADVTFVGGTIAPVGGHNVLEPAALGKPILLGPELHHVREIAHQLLEAGAALPVTGRGDLESTVDALFNDAASRDRMGQAGLALVEAGRGALQEALREVERHIPGSGAG